MRIADLAGTSLVIFPRAVTPTLYDAILAAQAERGWTPSVAQEAIQMQTLVSLVSAGIGAAWVPQTVTRLQRPGVVYRRVAGDQVRAETSLVWREPAPPVVQHFVEQVRRAMRRQSRTA